MTGQGALAGVVTIAVGPSRMLAVFRGEFDEHNSTGTVAGLQTGGCCDFDVDLAAVTFCSSAFIAALLRLRQSVVDNGCHLRVVAASTAVSRVFEITALGEVFDWPAGG